MRLVQGDELLGYAKVQAQSVSNCHEKVEGQERIRAELCDCTRTDYGTLYGTLYGTDSVWEYVETSAW